MSRTYPSGEKTPAEQREFLIYYAKVLLREARARRHQTAFHASLIGWAAKARREASEIDLRPAQGELFG